MRGEAVAQAVNAALRRQPRPLHSMVEDLLGSVIGQRLALVASEEQPLFGVEHAVVIPQLLQEPRGEEGVTILVALALLYPNLHARTVDVARFKPARFTQPQTATVYGHEERPVFGMHAADREQAFEFPDAVDPWTANRLLAVGHGAFEMLAVALEDKVEETAYPVDCDINRTAGQLLFLGQVHQVIFDLIIADHVWSLTMMCGQISHATHIGFLRFWCHPSYNEFPNELLT